MTLAAKLAFEFDKRVQFKGHGLARTGAIRVKDSGPDHIHSTVQGGQIYQVDLDLVNEALEAFCQCPYFNEWGPCKHLWAAILEADRIHALTNALEIRRLSLLPVEEDLDDEEEDLGFDEEEDLAEVPVLPPYPFGRQRY